MAFISAYPRTSKEFLRALYRRKYFDDDTISQTRLDRCLTKFDLTALGIGSTLGLGIYVLAGEVASAQAGPSVILSFFIAAVASVFAGLCYAEFGARVPKTGSAYVYSYVTIGELMAFIIGWNLILEYVIGTASVARGYSGYIDSLFNQTIQHTLEKVLPINLSMISNYPDFLALGITLLLTAMLAVGVKESTRFNNIFTVLNLLVVIYAVICGSFKADFHNWNLSKSEVGDNGSGGFFPFGFSGMMAGAATCFYGFVGFDCIATTGEEVKNPQKAIPFSIVVSLICVFFAYFGVSAIQTLMCPYWDLSGPASLPHVFEEAGWPVAKWIISVGALAGLSTSLLGGMFPLPRILYAMSSDGLIFKFLSSVHHRFKTPLLATLISGAFAGVMAMMFNVKELADMMSIGTLLAYTLVAVCVLVLRYRVEVENIPLAHSNVGIGTYAVTNATLETEKKINGETASIDGNCSGGTITVVRQLYSTSGTSTMFESTQSYTPGEIWRQVFNLNRSDFPTPLSSHISIFLVIIIGCIVVTLNLLLVALEDYVSKKNIPSIVCIGLLVLILVVLVTALSRQPNVPCSLSFKVPCVPLIPVISIFFNTYLMMKLSVSTWIRFAVWMFIGFLIYFTYGISHSSEGRKRRTGGLDSIVETSADEDDNLLNEDSKLLQ